METTKEIKKPAKELQVGDIIVTDCSYIHCPLDDQECKILWIKPSWNVFGEDCIDAEVLIISENKKMRIDWHPDILVSVVSKL